ncbi:MAG: esterase, partial [Clostridia bacterium]|nr:esterase [Clostridia bacterium]
HPYIEKYNSGRGIICVGQGPWELPETSVRLKELFEQKGINIWVDLWGHDVNHDWPWWHKQVEYFVPIMLGE